MASTQQESHVPMMQAVQTAPVPQIQPQPAQEVQVVHQQPVPLHFADPVILERVSKPRKSSWTDWIPDFFLEDESSEATGPGPLIGPIDMPGMGGQVFIKEKRPSDDTERVVIHLVKKPAPLILPSPYIFHQQTLPSHQIVGYPVAKETQLLIPAQEGSATGPNSVGPQYEIAKSEYYPQVIQGNPWAQQANIQENEIKDEKSATEQIIEIPKRDAQTQQTSAVLSKQAGSESPNRVWSQPFDGTVNNGSSTLHRSPAYDDVQQAPRYGIQNSSHASSAEVLTGVEQHQQQLRQPRNPYTLGQRLPQRQPQQPKAAPVTLRTSPAPVVGQGGLSVVPPPNLMASRFVANATTKSNASGDGSALVNSVMRLTANQTWRSPVARSSGNGGASAPGKKPSGLERKRPVNPTKPPIKANPSVTPVAAHHHYQRDAPLRRTVPNELDLIRMECSVLIH
ncbi:hypothetical protein QAD02_008535 [Eretmocerus hayati]|uniref:Uncharacterized protein n=1 Tax=Eretmocerus hayati TaxID=131215 RepID=A0ACC2N815_9HYME|nr:hypothetical protein QAD02_008535 [Eretmocerus hayati]